MSGADGTNAGGQNATVLSALTQAVRRAAAFNPDTHARPAAILWPDRDRQWERIAPLLRQVMPEFLAYGPYDTEARTGPAIWLKAMLGRTLAAATWPEATTPLVYVPGVGREGLRAIESCPKTLQPLVELQYRGVVWSQANHRDWTVMAFLKARDWGSVLMWLKTAPRVRQCSAPSRSSPTRSW